MTEEVLCTGSMLGMLSSELSSALARYSSSMVASYSLMSSDAATLEAATHEHNLSFALSKCLSSMTYPGWYYINNRWLFGYALCVQAVHVGDQACMGQQAFQCLPGEDKAE